MIELIALAIAMIGSTVGAIFDLKTTEIPEKILYAMITIGIFLSAVLSYQQSNIWPLAYSLIVGSGLLGFGALMYYVGIWGGADAFMLSAIGFLIPNLSIGKALMFPFAVSFVINVFMIGAVYMIVYAVVIALRNRKILVKFKNDMRIGAKLLLLASVALLAFFIGINWYLANILNEFNINFIIVNSLIPLSLMIGLFIIWKFSKAVENVGFKRRIPVSKLKIGDMLADSRLLDGITKEQWQKIRKTKRFVWIKEGVRFAPTFPLALLFTIFFGDAFLLFVNFMI